MPNELEIIEQIKKKMYESIEGVYSGDCKRLTVLRLEEAFSMLKKIEDLLKARIVLSE